MVWLDPSENDPGQLARHGASHLPTGRDPVFIPTNEDPGTGQIVIYVNGVPTIQNISTVISTFVSQLLGTSLLASSDDGGISEILAVLPVAIPGATGVAGSAGTIGPPGWDGEDTPGFEILPGAFGSPLSYWQLPASLVKSARFEYDFAIDGGAVSTITLRQTDGPLLDKFYANLAQFDVITAVTGGAGTTMALGTGQVAGDLVTATLVVGAPWSTTGLKPTTVVLGTTTTAIKMTANRSPVIDIGVNAVTAGKFILWIEGYQSA